MLSAQLSGPSTSPRPLLQTVSNTSTVGTSTCATQLTHSMIPPSNVSDFAVPAGKHWNRIALIFCGNSALRPGSPASFSKTFTIVFTCGERELSPAIVAVVETTV